MIIMIYHYRKLLINRVRCVNNNNSPCSGQDNDVCNMKVLLFQTYPRELDHTKEMRMDGNLGD